MPRLPLLAVLLLACPGGGPAGGPGGPDGGPNGGPNGAPNGGPGQGDRRPSGALGPGSAEPNRRPSDALVPTAPEGSGRSSSLRPPGEEVAVTIQLRAAAPAKTGSVVFLGMPQSGLDGTWVKPNMRPSFHWVSPVVDYAASVKLMAPLPPGLHYFAVLDLDGDDLPGPADFVSGPVGFEAGAGPLTFTIAGTLESAMPTLEDEGDGEEDDEEAPATSDGGEPRTLIISNEVRLPFIRTGRFMVVGLPPSPEDEFGYPPDSTASFLWASDATRLKWPVTFEALVPDGLDLIVVLDLDASGQPDVGDLTTEPIFAFKRPALGEAVQVTLATVIPIPDGDGQEDSPDEDEDEDEDEPASKAAEPAVQPTGSGAENPEPAPPAGSGPKSAEPPAPPVEPGG